MTTSLPHSGSKAVAGAVDRGDALMSQLTPKEVDLQSKTGGTGHEMELEPVAQANEDGPLAFDPTPDELDFLKKATRIDDTDELKRHVIDIQQKALKVQAYPHIRSFTFVKPKITRMKTYQKALILAQRRKGALMLDVGCGFGVDARKAVLDGYPAENIIAVDMHQEVRYLSENTLDLCPTDISQFWALGRQLFRDSGDTMPINFVPGSIFQLLDSTLSEPSTEQSPPLKSLRSLSPLKGRLSVIHVSNMFHYYDRKHQEELARILGSLLSPQKASMIFGNHIGALVAGGEEEAKPHFAHNEKSWEELWQRVLGKDKCVVKARLKEAPEWVQKIGVGTHLLYWSVERPMT